MNPSTLHTETVQPLATKVVMDSSASSALLALAYNEGLLTESESADNCLSRLTHTEYPDWLTIQALEQVVLFEQVHITQWLPWKGIHGPLMESGPLVPVETKVESNDEIQEIDSGILNSILKAHGVSPTPFEDPAVIERANKAHNDLKDWEQRYGEESPNGTAYSTAMIGDFILQVAARKGAHFSQKYAELKAIRERLGEITKIGNVMQEYLRVIAIAQDRVANVMTPLYPDKSDHLYRPSIARVKVNTQTALLQLTASRLGVLPYGQSLKQTLKLARDPATTALRVKIQEWTESLMEQSGSTTERIQREIAEALQFLEKGSVGGTISNVTTYLAVPIGLAATVSDFASAIGWICNFAGVIGLAGNHITARKYQWASFGSSNRG